MGITFALSVVILFLGLFFIFSRYVVDGQLIIPWLMDDMPVVTASPPEEPSEDEPSDEEVLDNEPVDTIPNDMTFPDIENPVTFPPGDEDLNTFIPGDFDLDTLPPDDE